MLKFIIGQYKPVNLVLRTETPIDDFHFDECVPCHSGKPAVIVSNPLYVIFNQKRLASVGEFPLQEWIDSMNSIQSDSFKELRSKVSDEDLVSVLKSRYCQKPSELAQWSAYLSAEMDKLSAEVQEYVKNKEFSSDDPSRSSDDRSGSSVNVESNSE